MSQMTPNELADYIEKWYEGGRNGLKHVLEAQDVETAQQACERWFMMGDRRIGKVLAQLRGVNLETDRG